MEHPFFSPELKIELVHSMAKVPTYATDGSACFDIYSIESGSFGLLTPSMIFRTGLKFEIPHGWAMEIYSRSGQGFNKDVRLANCVGIIDSDYRDEVMVKLTVDRTAPIEVLAGERIAQAKLVPAYRTQFKVVEQVSSPTTRFGGFGSTGQ